MLSAPSPRGSAACPAVSRIADALAFGLVVVATTYVSLIIGELVPKRLALRNAEGIASSVSGPMTFLAAAGAPSSGSSASRPRRCSGFSASAARRRAR